MKLTRLLIFWLALGVTLPLSQAQNTATLRGSIHDESGQAVANATVSVQQEATRLSRSVSTGADGSFEFLVLPVGSYSISVEAARYVRYERSDVALSIGQIMVVNPTLVIQAAGPVLNVRESLPILETNSNQLGVVMNQQAVANLPLSSHDAYQLLQLQPGVQSTLGSDLFYGSDFPGVVSVNGGRGRANNYNVNSGQAGDQFVNFPAIQPSPDAIQEFRVISNTFDAELGGNSASVLNVVTKSGSNEFHGNAYEYFRNKVLNARGYFDLTQPDFKQNEFGGTFGGPIRRDRTFFFVSYEGRRLRRGISSDSVIVPTAQERMGDFSAGPAFSGTLNDAAVAEALNTRPGCPAATAAAGGAPIVAGTAYAAIFPGNSNGAAPAAGGARRSLSAIAAQFHYSEGRL